MLILILLFGYGSTTIAATMINQEHPQEDKTKLKVEVDAGYNGYGKYADYMPVYATITNQGAPYTGWFQVIIPNQNNKSALYQQEVTLEQGETVQLELPVLMNGSRDQFHYQLIDINNKIIVEKNVSVKLLRDQGYTYIGVLSKRSTDLEYLENETVKTIYLKNSRLTSDYRSLKPLDIIMIDDYNLDNISDNNWSAIEKWVRTGGNLLIGDVPADNIPLYKKVQDQSAIDNPIYTEYRLSQGKIQIAKINLRRPEKIDPLQEDIIQRMLHSLPETKSEEYGSIYGTPYYNYREMDALNISDKEDIPSTWKYALLLFIYVLLIGPILYIILKKKDARILTWNIVPLLAIIGTVIIYILGADTRKTQTTGYYIAYQTIGEDGTYIEETYYKLISPENEGYQVNNLSMDSMGIITNQYAYANTGDTSEYDYSSYSTGVTIQDGNSNIMVNASGVYEPTYYTYTRSGTISGTYEYNIRDEMERVTGYFTNNLGYDLEDGVLFCNQILIPIGDIQDKETISLEGRPQVDLANVDMVYDMDKLGEILFEQPQLSRVYDSEVLRRFYTIRRYIDESILNYNEKNYIVGFPVGMDDQTKSLLESTDIDVSGVTALILPVQVNQSLKDGSIYIPNIMQYLESADNYQPSGYRYMTHEIVDIRYQFNREDKITSIAYSQRGNNEFAPPIQTDSTGTNNNTWLYKIGFNGDIYFYNNRTMQHDIAYRSGVAGVRTDLKDYIDENNSILIRYKVDRTDVERGLAMLPNLTATRGGD